MRMRIGLLGVALATVAATGVSADPLDDLVDAIARFRGLGDESVSRYRVEMRVPDETEEVAPLVETWEAPARLGIRAAHASTPAAVVRGLAVFLEPLFVTRSSIYSIDLDSGRDVVRSEGQVSVSETASGLRSIRVVLPENSANLPEMLKDLVEVGATLDGERRLVDLTVRLRTNGTPQAMTVHCDWQPRQPQPGHATWVLPNGQEVGIETEFREESGRLVPASRHVTFPSRYDPGDTESIRVEYGTYEIDPEIPEEFWSERGTLRFDTNGLVTN
ncbi:MAG: hypothetical protein R3B81_08800 [bacterium]